MVKGKEPSKKEADNPDGLMNIHQGSSGERDLQVWRRKLDDLKNKTLKKGEHLDGMRDRLGDIQKQEDNLKKLSTKSNTKDEGNNPLKKMRVLENKLDKAMMKFNEAMSIKKTYDMILKRLNEERVAYEKQLE